MVNEEIFFIGLFVVGLGLIIVASMIDNRPRNLQKDYNKLKAERDELREKLEMINFPDDEE